jgi:hypothetical protein
MKGIRYSPYPPERYSREDESGRFGVGLEFVDEQFLPWWNLYWLSEPAVDALMLPDNEWHASKPCDLRLPEVTAEALGQKLGGVPLQALLRQPAHVFLQQLKASPHKHLKPYKLLGEAWTTCVLERGAKVQVTEKKIEAAPETAKPSRVVSVRGNVVRVNFSLENQTMRMSSGGGTNGGGTNMYCPGCDTITPCKAVPAAQVTYDSSDYAQRQQYTEHSDIQFFQRGRKCLECGHKFVSAEVNLGFLEELVELRHALSSIKANAERYVKESAAASSSLAELSASLGVLRALKIYKDTGD